MLTHRVTMEVTGTPEGLLGAAGVRMRDASAFAVYWRSLVVVNGRVRTPGGRGVVGTPSLSRFFERWRALMEPMERTPGRDAGRSLPIEDPVPNVYSALSRAFSSASA